MRTRKDGEATRAQILAAACEVFAEKGFRRATHAAICRKAGTNTAAVNYHFGSKEGLYRAVWVHTKELMHEHYPATRAAAADPSPQRRLRLFVETVLRKMSDRDAFGYAHRLHLTEQSHPSGVVDDLLEESRAPYRAELILIVRSLLGASASAETVTLCEKSVISQIRLFLFGMSAPPHRDPPLLDAAQIELLAGHVTRFSLAGIEAVARADREAVE